MNILDINPDVKYNIPANPAIVYTIYIIIYNKIIGMNIAVPLRYYENIIFIPNTLLTDARLLVKMYLLPYF